MLIEFSVSNHRAIADEQTISLVAAGTREPHPERVVQVGTSPIEVLTSALIMGKNGGGKSSLVQAMRFVARFVGRSATDTQKGEKIPWQPHKFDRDLESAPTLVRILFSMHGNIYQFEFSFDSLSVKSESLSVADKTSRFKRMYERVREDDGDYTYKFGSALKGEKSLWQNATRDNALFISTAVSLNSTSLEEPFRWLTTYLCPIDATSSSFAAYTSKQCKDPVNQSTVVEFLRMFDINVDRLEVEEEPIDEGPLSDAFKPEFFKMVIKNLSPSRNRVRFVRDMPDGRAVQINLEEESTGSKALFALAGPIFDTLQNGYCLVVDEISTSLHPLVMHTLIDLFSDPSVNRRRAQLVFTSHDVSLLKDSYFRRDQVWFSEKDELFRSKLVPLSDYSPRIGEAMDRGYLGGRYGGVPYIKSNVILAAKKVLWKEVAGE